jgi:hypothetical protein
VVEWAAAGKLMEVATMVVGSTRARETGAGKGSRTSGVRGVVVGTAARWQGSKWRRD